jgi:hypothetical protein
VYDGQSTLVGAQTATLTLVDQELHGQGTDPEGWLAGGITSVVLPATLYAIDVFATALIHPDADLITTQATLAQTISTHLQQRTIGDSVRYIGMLLAMEHAVPGLLQIAFTLPTVFTLGPPVDFFIPVGGKAIPGTITVLTTH